LELCKGKGENGSDVIVSKRSSIQTRADILFVNASNLKKEKGACEKVFTSPRVTKLGI
jgi:hypothetical protein